MGALLTLLFVLGIVAALFVTASQASQPHSPQVSAKGTKLDTVDEMFLFGEVTEDEFYRM